LFVTSASRGAGFRSHHTFSCLSNREGSQTGRRKSRLGGPIVDEALTIQTDRNPPLGTPASRRLATTKSGAILSSRLREVKVWITDVVLIGKESRHLGVGRDVLTAPEFIEYGRDDPWADFRAALGRLSKEGAVRRALLQHAGFSERAFDYLSQGRRSPKGSTRQSLFTAIAREARLALRTVDAFGVSRGPRNRRA
jgi:hypothetical protein